MFKYILFIVISLLPLSAIAQKKVYKVAVDEHYHPFAYTDESGNMTGFDVDIATALCKSAKIECELIIVPFDKIIDAISSKKIDFAVMGLSKTAEREKVFLFSDKYYRSNNIFVGVHGEIETTAEGLAGKTVALQAESLHYKYIKENYPDSVKILTFTEFEDIVQALKERKADIALVGGLAGYAKLKTPDWAAFEVIGEPINLGSSFIVFGKQHTKIRDAINIALQEIRKSGTYDKINRKYFDFNIY